MQCRSNCGAAIALLHTSCWHRIKQGQDEGKSADELPRFIARYDP